MMNWAIKIGRHGPIKSKRLNLFNIHLCCFCFVLVSMCIVLHTIATLVSWLLSFNFIAHLYDCECEWECEWCLPTGADLNDRSSAKSVVLFMDADCTCAIRSAHTTIAHNMVDLLTLIGLIVVNCFELECLWKSIGFLFCCSVLFMHFVASSVRLFVPNAHGIKKQSEINNENKKENEWTKRKKQ